MSRPAAPAPEHRAPASDLKGRTVHSILWSVVRVGWSSLATFVLFAVLARLLAPAQFGLFALASLFVEAARVLAGAGLADAVTREADLTEEQADTAFWAHLGCAALVALATAALALPYSRFVDQPEVVPLVAALAPLMVVGALGGIHTARLLREFGHKAVALRTLAVSLASSALAIASALHGLGAWSLVVQAATGEIAGVAFAWATFRWRPRLRFSRAALRGLLGFGASMVATNLLWVVLVRVPEVFIGRLLGSAEVGRYRVAWRLIDLLGQAVLAPIGSVCLVTLSRVQHDMPRFRRIYALMLVAAALVALPLLLGLGALADDVIPLVFGAQWRGDGDLVRVLALMALPFTMNYLAAPALAAVGRSHAVLRVAALQLALQIGLSWLAAPYGLAAVAAAYVARAYLTMPYQIHVLQRHTGIDAVGSVKALALLLAIAAGMAGAVYLCAPAMRAALPQRWASTAALVAFGGAVYALLLYGFAREKVLTVLRSLRPMLRGAA